MAKNERADSDVSPPYDPLGSYRRGQQERAAYAAGKARAAEVKPAAPKAAVSVVMNLDDVGDDDADLQDERIPLLRSARRRERARYCAIMSSPIAKTHPVIAAHMAILTSMPRTEAIAFIEATAAAVPAQGSSDGLAQRIVTAGRRARGEEPMAPTTPKQSEGHHATADQIIKAGRKARGE